MSAERIMSEGSEIPKGIDLDELSKKPRPLDIRPVNKTHRAPEALNANQAADKLAGLGKTGDQSGDIDNRGERRTGRAGEQLTLKAEFASLDDGQAREKLEQLISAVENQQKVKFEESHANQIYEALYDGLTARPLLQSELLAMLNARFKYHNQQYAVIIEGAEAYATWLGSIQQKDNDVILGIVGVKEAVRMMEAPDDGPAGLYFMDKDAPEFSKRESLKPRDEIERGGQSLSIKAALDPREIWILRHKMDLMRIIQGQLSAPESKQLTELMTKNKITNDVINKVLRYIDKGKQIQSKDLGADEDKFIKLLPEQAVIEVLTEKGINISEQTALAQGVTDILQQTNRAWNLAEKACNVVGISGRFDAPRLKSEQPGGYGELAKLDSVPFEYNGVKYDLVTNPPPKDVLSEIRKKPFLIPVAWDRAWRDFFKDNSDSIDAEKSMRGNAPATQKRNYYYPAFLGRSENPNPGKAAYLRRYTYLGVQDLARYTARTSVEDQLSNWDGDLGTRLAWVGRIKGAEKARKLFTEEGPRLLNDANSVNSPIKSLTEIRSAMNYLPEDEQLEHNAFLLEGIVRFLQRDNARVFHYKNMDAIETDHLIQSGRMNSLINKNQENILRHQILGGRVRRQLRFAYRPDDILAALLEGLKAMAKAIVSTK